MTDFQKDILRTEARRHRARIDPAHENTEEAARLFWDSLKPQKDQIVAAYWPKGREFDPRPAMEKLLAAGIGCALPVMREGSKVMDFVLWRDEEALAPGPYGIMQPVARNIVEPDIVIVPLLAFDRRGIRLGQGGGYYDATLEALRKKKTVIAVGMAYATQAVLFNLPREEHDQRLDWVITPQSAHFYGDL
ncbi:MAG: 5-formyltetrahydrofolate cyclo-ligase [Alphaproteobacteria bacterium]|nr:5-formyltetrahydrofolate cyclo-ligase [Alphaproteobacteria bacterium]MCD8570584.1 5-formyltetrahydrofolate cyclo-ligase [Alphaproteobacteria bacterium]